MTKRSTSSASAKAAPAKAAKAVVADASAAGTNLADSYASLVTGLGTPGIDKSINGALAMGTVVSDQHLLQLYRNDFLARQVVDVPADDATRPWRVWNGEAKDNSALFDEEKRLRVRDRVRQALKQARLFGGAALVIHDGQADLSKPFIAASVKKGGLKALVVANRMELQPQALNKFVNDPADPHYGIPEMWNWTQKRFVQQGHKTIHHSRLVFITHGDAIDDGTRAEWWWGDSALEPVLSAIGDASGARSAATHLMQEANVDVIQTEGLLGRLETVKGREQVLTAAGLMSASKSNYRLLMLDKSQEYSRNAFSFGGIKDIVEIQHALVAAAADIPITRLLGRSPAGMNATGESDMLNYFAMLTAIQESTLSPCMSSFDEALIRSTFGDMKAALWYDWRRPDTLTEDMRVKHAEIRAKTVQTLAATGVMPEPVLEAAVESMLTETGDMPGAEAAYAKWREEGNEIDFKDDDPPDDEVRLPPDEQPPPQPAKPAKEKKAPE
ncbi:MAG: DUF1073 domain-containing protein [Acidobacteria bacterium]|nr:DUF1073 domain-containing protein [Acidobacteriota bacterium]